MANTYQIIASSTVGSGGVADITFSAIPATYTDVLVSLSLRSDRTGQDFDDIGLTINGVTTNRTWKLLLGLGNSVSSDNGTNALAGIINASTSTASTFGNAQIYFPNYADSNYKSFSSDSVSENNATAARIYATAGLWSQTAAITSIKITPLYGTLFLQHSTAYLYGIKNS
jgi:hypothetical protein